MEGVPRIAVLAGGVNQDIWSLRELGFPADPISTSATGALNNPAGPNPLDDYDVVFNTCWVAGATSATARARLDAFFDAGGGYIGAGASRRGLPERGELRPAARTGTGFSYRRV